LKIILDTNVFNDKIFLSWLKNQNLLIPHVNSIVYLELGYIYRVRNKWQLFVYILSEFNVKYIPDSKKIVEKAIELALIFKDEPQGAAYYFRDCLIGATAQNFKLKLITNNIDYFPYLKKNEIFKPDDFMQFINKVIDELKNQKLQY